MILIIWQDPKPFTDVLMTGDPIAVLGLLVFVLTAGPLVAAILLGKRWFAGQAARDAVVAAAKRESDEKVAAAKREQDDKLANAEAERDEMHRSFLAGINKTMEEQTACMRQLATVSGTQVQMLDAVRQSAEAANRKLEVLHADVLRKLST